MPYNDKVDNLRRRFQDMGSAVVAFSGGVDSSVLVSVAYEELGNRMLAATGVSPSLPESDHKLVRDFCAEKGIPHRFVETFEFDDPEFKANPDDRCYHCKRNLYKSMLSLADEVGFVYVVEGTNESDLGGHRPGYRASRENDRIMTPLIEAHFTKDDVRRLARELKLPMAEKPAAACLSSRIPMGVTIDEELVRRLDKAEDLLRSIGVDQVRVRHHGDIARIEVDADDMHICLERRDDITAGLRELGWKFVTLDLVGYRTGGSRG